MCHGGDPDRGVCNVNVSCHPDEELFVSGLMEVARQHPTSGLLQGQAVYALVKFGYVEEAEALVQECGAEGWWCEALRGYVLYAFAPLPVVEERFRRAYQDAPSEVRCRWGDALWLLGDWDQRAGGLEDLPPGREATEDWPCTRRLSVSDTLFWLADPLFSQEGNERWTVHMARAVAGQLQRDLKMALRGASLPQEVEDRDWAMRIRRGEWDSYQRFPGRREPRVWTSEEAASVHFLPDVEPDDLTAPRWRYDGDIQDEGYTPEGGGFHAIASQVTRFREGDSLLLLAAAGLEPTRLRRSVEATSHLVLSDGPGSFPLLLHRETRQSTPVLQGKAPHGEYVVSLEVETRIGMGVSREFLPPLSILGPELSDLLLYDSEGDSPNHRAQAAERMMGSLRMEEGDFLGVFWEVYGGAQGDTLSFELTLERESGGLVERLTGLFPGGEEGDRGRVTWREPAVGEVHPRGLTLNLRGLRSGEYTLVLTVQWPGQIPLERRRGLRVG
jgi:hypothetical protein